VSSLFYILANIVYQVVITLLIQLKLKIRLEFGVESTLVVHVYHNNLTQLHNVKQAPTRQQASKHEESEEEKTSVAKARK
jgi:hypothetical protein